MIYRALTAVAGAALRGAAPLAGETLAEVFVDLPPVSIVGVSRLRYDDQVVELEAVAAL